MGKATKATTNKKAYKDHAKTPFLVAYRKFGVIWRAARSVGISRDAVHDWRRNDQIFASAFNEVHNETTELLEASAVQQALKGHTALLIFLLKSRKPQMYSERFRHRLKNRDLSQPVATIAGIARRMVPDQCARCGHDLAIRKSLSDELERVAESFALAT